MPDVTMVVTLLPPAPRAELIVPRPNGKKQKDGDKPGKFQSQALFYRPGDLVSQLRVPQGQDGRAYLVLERRE